MEYKEFIKEFNRMCRTYKRSQKCKGCPMGLVNISQCRADAFKRPERVEMVVEKWSKENPEIKRITWGTFLCKYGIVDANLLCDDLLFDDGKLFTVRYNKLIEEMPDELIEKLGI